MILASLIILLSVILEGSITSIPLTLASLILFSFFLKKESSFILAFSSGIILDILAFQTLGISSAFFLLSLFIVYLYQNKIEQNNLFVFIASFISGVLYLFIVKGNFSIFAPLVSSLLAFILFSAPNIRKVKIKEQKLKFQI
jgi:cell shape-determining protein MreD